MKTVSIERDGTNPFPAIRRICMSNNLCFDCLKPYDDEHKRLRAVKGKRSCPNKSVPVEEKLKMLRDSVLKKQALNSEGPTHISAVQLELEEYEALPASIKDDTTQFLESFWSTLQEPNYKSSANQPMSSQ